LKIYYDERLHQALGYKTPAEVLYQWSVKQGEELVAHRVACAAETVKGLRSPSLAPMNAASYKTVRVALDCLPRYGWKVHKGSCRSPFENGAGQSLIQAGFLSNDWGEAQTSPSCR
jgi:hypothetical protein